MSDEEDAREPIPGMAIPRNGLTGKKYQGSNIPELQAVMLDRGFESAEFVTFLQAREIGFPVPKGVKSCGCIVKWIKPKNGSGAKRSAGRKNKTARLFPKTSAVWNLEQIDTENYEGSK